MVIIQGSFGSWGWLCYWLGMPKSKRFGIRQMRVLIWACLLVLTRDLFLNEAFLFCNGNYSLSGLQKFNLEMSSSLTRFLPLSLRLSGVLAEYGYQ
ncbi:hypothetical protein NG798_02925 [Ancylothrix sp. C2]|nr:hypothetical protein [Ancylothrix sp. D3o]